jgi:hypothetical protein
MQGHTIVAVGGGARALGSEEYAGGVRGAAMAADVVED